jgi:15-cis-phytoene synthase
MQDAFAYCAALVRTADRDRYLASLFAPVERRGGLHALYAFNTEIARVRDAARQPLAGEIRLQWWSEVLRGERDSEAAANPVAFALLATIATHHLAPTKLIELIEARRFDLYDDPMMLVSELEAYVTKTSSALFAVAANILADADAKIVVAPAGIAYGMTTLLQAFPLHAARHQLYVPVELLERHHVRTSDVFAGRSSPGLNAALAELRNSARDRLAEARNRMSEVHAAALPAFLPLALVRPSLDRLDRTDAFTPAELAPWRRQWLIWRAAHNPARIAG